MPTYAVKQPNGKYALWSTVVDTFHAWNLTADAAIARMREHMWGQRYPGGNERLQADLVEMIRLCDTNPDGKPWEWCETFDYLLWWMVYFNGMDTERLAQMLNDHAITQEQYDAAIKEAQKARDIDEAVALVEASNLLLPDRIDGAPEDAIRRARGES